MKFVLICYFSLGIFTSLLCQTEAVLFIERIDSIYLSELKGKIDDIDQRISNLNFKTDALTNENKELLLLNSQLQNDIDEKDSLELVIVRNKIIKAIENGDVVAERAISTLENLEKEDLFTQLISLNNPTSDLGGFKFTDVITEKSKDIFEKKLTDAKSKRRWGSIVGKIINNKFVADLLVLNPVTSLVSNVISSASTFFSSVEGSSRIKEINDAFSEDDISSRTNLT